MGSGSAPGGNGRDLIVYDQKLGADWDDWSWNTEISRPAYGGGPLGAKFTARHGGISLRTSKPINGKDYESIEFTISHGASHWALSLKFHIHPNDGDRISRDAYITVPSGLNRLVVVVPMAVIGNPTRIARLTWQDGNGNAENRKHKFFLDKIKLSVSLIVMLTLLASIN